MGEEIVETILSEEFKTPEIKTRLQAFALIATGLSFFWSNDRKVMIFLLIASFVVALVLYNNVNLITEVYKLLPK